MRKAEALTYTLPCHCHLSPEFESGRVRGWGIYLSLEPDSPAELAIARSQDANGLELELPLLKRVPPPSAQWMWGRKGGVQTKYMNLRSINVNLAL